MLFGKRRPAATANGWQAEIDASLESGQTPLLDLGGSQRMLDSLPVLTALRTFRANRVDVTTPLLIAGGNHWVWLTVLMQARSPDVPARSPDPTVVFAGADWASYMATLTTLTPERSLALPQAANATPPSMRPLFMPYAPAQALVSWESLPFAMMEEAQTGYGPAERPLAPPTEEWVHWLAIGASILLLLSALMIAILR